MIDFTTITACGECCVGCAKKIEGLCPGCLEADGKVPEWAQSGVCKVHACAKEHGVQFCGICGEFPCEKLPTMISWNLGIVEHQTQLRDEYLKQNNIYVRRAVKNDVASIAEILVEDWKIAYDGIIDRDFLDSMNAEERYHIEVKRYDKQFVATDGTRVLGYSWLEPADDEAADCEVIALYVRYSERKNGIGRTLLSHAFNHFRKLGKHKMIIWCLKDNVESRKFYEKMGGKEYRINTHKWGDKDYVIVSYLYDL